MMASYALRVAPRAARAAQPFSRPTRLSARRTYADAPAVTGGAGESREQNALKQGARRNPELYILAAVMTGAFSMAGYYFARSPTNPNSEHKVSMAEGSYPWESGTSGKYQYHPGGDRTKAPKDAPSALHSVVVPNVNLPAYLHEQYNKYDKEEYDDY